VTKPDTRAVPQPTVTAQLLEEWRQLERDLSKATDNDAKVALNEMLERIRADYQQAIDEAIAAQAPLPKPLPTLPAFDHDQPTD
jgi:hypothetical protein